MLATVTQIRALPNLVPTNIDPVIDQQAWELLYTNPQHPWSHVDATSIVLMRQLNISEVLTADHHFAQAGFTVLR
jgi:predicted nucleic acid-binding protein